MQDQQIQIINVSLPNTSNLPMLGRTVQTRDSPYLMYPSDWELCITRMHCSLELVPLFFPTIPDPVGFPLQTTMSITLNYLGNYFRQYVQVTPEEVKNGVTSYSLYLQEINAASTLAFNLLKAAFPAASGTAPPLFYLDSATALISMYVQDDYLETNANRIQIGFNVDLAQILALPFDQMFPAPNPNGFEYLLSVNNDAILLPAAPRTGVPLALSAIAGNLLQVTQDFSSLVEWDDIKGLYFVSNILPVTPQLLPNVTLPNQVNNQIAKGAQNILIDFELIKGNPFESRQIAQYFPQSEFKMLSMVGTSPINVIDIQVFYVTYTNVRRDLYLNPNTSLGIQLYFRPKFKLVREPSLGFLLNVLIETINKIKGEIMSKLLR
jgi:hypothetical protein